MPQSPGRAASGAPPPTLSHQPHGSCQGAGGRDGPERETPSAARRPRAQSLGAAASNTPTEAGGCPSWGVGSLFQAFFLHVALRWAPRWRPQASRPRAPGSPFSQGAQGPPSDRTYGGNLPRDPLVGSPPGSLGPNPLGPLLPAHWPHLLGLTQSSSEEEGSFSLSGIFST